MDKNYVVIEADLNTKNFEKQIEEVEYRLKELDYELSHAKELNLDERTIKEYELEAEKLTNQLVKLNKQQAELNKHDFSQLGKGIESITKKVGRWALAIFGVRSAYMFVRNAINTIAGDNEQLANDIDNMKRALAYTIEPVVQTIVNLAKTLMGYIAYIVKAWTGRDIFASASKNLKSASKSAKELQKSSASFDKFNKISSNKSSGGGGAGTSGFDLKAPEDADVPIWLRWIAENKEIIIGALTGIALGLLAIKLADPTTWIVLAIALIAGLVTAIVTNWDKIKDVLVTVGEWIYANVIQPVIDAFVWLWNTLVKIFTPIIEFFKNIFITVWQNIKAIFENIGKIFVWLWEKIKEIFSPLVNFFYNVFKEAGESLKPFIDAVVGLWDKVKGALKKFGVKVGEVIGSAFKTTFNGIMKVIETFLNAPIKAINGLIKIINKVPGIDLNTLTEFKLPRLAKGGIVNMPGKGINYAGANIAERGPEAIVPFTDTAQMELLGESIGKHTKINADITLELESRVLARVMQEINNDNKFARNGG